MLDHIWMFLSETLCQFVNSRYFSGLWVGRSTERNCWSNISLKFLTGLRSGQFVDYANTMKSFSCSWNDCCKSGEYGWLHRTAERYYYHRSSILFFMKRCTWASIITSTSRIALSVFQQNFAQSNYIHRLVFFIVYPGACTHSV